jgi:(4S)-4-hydroxy-5-phosphonooxypentane-2,3-dione isomerase
MNILYPVHTCQDILPHNKVFKSIPIPAIVKLVLYSIYDKENVMLVVHVFVHVKPGQAEAFKAATVENARNSIEEDGIVRFDVVQQEDDPDRFVLVEVYRTVNDTVLHKETAHYLKWRDTVADMMAGLRTNLKYSNIFPEDENW